MDAETQSSRDLDTKNKMKTINTTILTTTFTSFKNRPGTSLMIEMSDGTMTIFPPAVHWDDQRAHVVGNVLFTLTETDDTRGHGLWVLVGEVAKVSEIHE